MKKPFAELHSLMLVHWQDSKQPTAAWTYLDDLPKLKVAEVETVGFLVAEDDEIIMLAQSMANVNLDDAQACGCMQIPKRCIVSHILLGAASQSIENTPP